jgi:integrase/recombinase XerC
MQKLVDLYIQSLVARNAATTTISGYRTNLHEFMDFVGPIEATGVTRGMVRQYLVHIMRKGLKRSSVRRNLAAIKSFFKFMADENLISQDIARSIDAPKVPRQITGWYSREEITQMLGQTFLGVFPERDRLIVELLYATGVRVDELSKINLEDIQQNYVILIRGKGKKERLVIFGEDAEDALRIYLAARTRVLKNKQCTSNALFFGLTAGGAEIEPLTVRQISRIVKQAARTSGVPVLHPHAFRHTFGTHMLEGGASLVAVSKLLGHSKLSTTERYVHVSPALMLKAYHGAFPQAKPA